MKRTVSVLAFISIFTLLFGSCNPRGNRPIASSPPTSLTGTKDWNPPVFPGSVPDEELQADMTAVAATPGAIDETAWDCFGFPVHNALFHAYRSDAKPQEIMDFYSKEMAAQGWRKIAVRSADSTLPRQTWQFGESGPLVAYVLILPMKGGRTSIYLSVAESDSPQPVIEK